MGPDFGRGMGEAIVGEIIVFAIGGVAVGVALAFIVPWIFHHVSVSLN